ncbi:MAG: RsiG family protein [Acidimicrobiales bacterium]
MPHHSDHLDRMLTSNYLDGIDARPLSDIRSMRTECQEAEVELSYFRRLVQGRLDIVHTYLEHPGSDALRDLGALVNDLPSILSSGPGRPPGPGHLPQLLSPDTEGAELTEELDAVLGPSEIGTLAELDVEQLESIAGRLESIEQRVSAERRALHERIDALQAELVERHKTGRATVDGLLA